MPGLNLTEAAGLLKEVYLPVIREQLNNKTLLLTQIEKNTVDVEGSEAILSLHVERNSGVGARLEGGTLPTPGNQKSTKERVPLRTLTGRFQVTVQAIKAMRSGKGAFERATEGEMKRLTIDAKRDLNRQLAGDSTGTIATTAAGAASNTITLASTTSKVQMRQFEVGMRIDVSAAATPGNAAIAANRKVTAVNRTAKTVTVDGAAFATSAGDRVERQGNGGTGATQKEVTGLQTIVSDTGALHNVDPATYPVWKAGKDDPGANRTPTELVFETAIDESDIESGEPLNLFLTTHGVARGFAAQLTSMKRTVDKLELKGGFSGVSVSSSSGRAAMVPERDIKANTAFGVNTEHLQKHEEQDWDFMDEDGAVLSRVPNELAYEGTLYSIIELTTDQRNSHYLVGSLTES